MRIWLIEDNELQAAHAAKCIWSVAKIKLGKDYPRSLELYWDATIEWKPTFRLMNEARSEAPANAVDRPPHIVILDLFNARGFFAEQFLGSLRNWELSLSGRPAWVILWSVNPGLQEVARFLDKEPRRDRHLIATQTKQPSVLSEKILGCWQSWEEEQYP